MVTGKATAGAYREDDGEFAQFEQAVVMPVASPALALQQKLEDAVLRGFFDKQPAPRWKPGARMVAIAAVATLPIWYAFFGLQVFIARWSAPAYLTWPTSG